MTGQTFIDRENIQKQINFENQIFELLGPGLNTITSLNIGKSDLVRLEQELDLYKKGIKQGLSPEMIGSAEEAIQLHWDNVNNIENQIKDYAVLGGSFDVVPVAPIEETLSYRNGVWELYKGDHDVLFNMVEKKDEALYKALGANDEAYAEFISPYVTRYMAKIGDTAGSYWNSLQWAYNTKGPLIKDDVASLKEMYHNSLEIYKCFTKNFQEPVGANQQELMGSIQEWHTNQAFLGANSLIEAYNNYGMEANPGAVVMSFFNFDEAPENVKEKIGLFLRNDILNNEEFINTEDTYRLNTRVDALIGLKYLNLLNEEEKQVFDEAIQIGVIEDLGKSKLRDGNVFFRPRSSPSINHKPTYQRFFPKFALRDDLNPKRLILFTSCLQMSFLPVPCS